ALLDGGADQPSVAVVLDVAVAAIVLDLDEDVRRAAESTAIDVHALDPALGHRRNQGRRACDHRRQLRNRRVGCRERLVAVERNRVVLAPELYIAVALDDTRRDALLAV